VRWWRRGLDRLGVRTGPGRDAVAAGLLLVLLAGGRLVVAALVAARQPVPAAPTAADVAIGIAITAADCLPIALRRRLPRPALLLALAVVVGSGALGRDLFADPGPGLVVCAYTVATLLPWRRAVPLLGGAVVAHWLAAPLIGDLSSLPTYWGTPGDNRWATAWASLASVGIPALVGSWVQTRRAYTAELVDRAERLRSERDERARTAVLEERGRIARELHDIAAHDLSAMVVQAGAADRLVERDPEAARATLKELRAQGRDTLSQLRRLVGVMRGPDSDGLAPQPSLLRLDELVAGVREAGAAVEVVTTGAARPLPPEVDLAAYRVVQEALVNTRRHAPGAAVRVEVGYSADGVRVAVADTGAAGPVEPPPAGGGNGLLGMRERVRLAGGTLSVGSTPDGGWQVEARLPVAGS
jgi:signal transduction histidine kinase